MPVVCHNEVGDRILEVVDRRLYRGVLGGMQMDSVIFVVVVFVVVVVVAVVALENSGAAQLSD